MYKQKKVTTQEGTGTPKKLGELGDVDVSYAAPRRLHAGIYWKQVSCLCGPRPTNGVARPREGLGSLCGDGPAAQDSEGDKCQYPAVFQRPRDQEHGRFRALYPEDEQ